MCVLMSGMWASVWCWAQEIPAISRYEALHWSVNFLKSFYASHDFFTKDIFLLFLLQTQCLQKNHWKKLLWLCSVFNHCRENTDLLDTWLECYKTLNISPKSKHFSLFTLLVQIWFMAYPIGIQSYLVSMWTAKKAHEINFLQFCFKPHSYMAWNAVQIPFLEIYFSLITL